MTAFVFRTTSFAAAVEQGAASHAALLVRTFASPSTCRTAPLTAERPATSFSFASRLFARARLYVFAVALKFMMNSVCVVEGIVLGSVPVLVMFGFAKLRAGHAGSCGGIATLTRSV